MSTNEIKEKVKLLSLIGVALHKYGTSAHRLEASLKFISNYLGLKGNFFSTPTYLALSFDADDEQIVRHLRVTPGEENLEKLQEVDSIANKICHEGMAIKDAIKQLQDLDARPSSYGALTQLVAFSLTSMSLALILQGDAIEMTLSFLIGSIVGILALLKSKNEKLSEIFEFLASFIVMMCCFIFQNAGLYFNYQIVLISSLIVIIPGLGLTVAMTELATQNLASGTARLMGALIVFFKISFGILLSVEIGKHLFEAPVLIDPTPVNQLYILPALIIASLSFTVIFNARKSDSIWVLLSSFVTIGTLFLSQIYLNQILSVFFAAFTIGLVSNAFARIKKRPSAIMLVPGIIFIVPGTVGLKGLNLIFQKDFVAGLSGGFQMFILAITIVAGLFLANVTLNPRKSL